MRRVPRMPMATEGCGAGAGFLLVSCATGTLSLGLRCIAQVCNQADRLFCLTPVGEHMAALAQASLPPRCIPWLCRIIAASSAVKLNTTPPPHGGDGMYYPVI